MMNYSGYALDLGGIVNLSRVHSKRTEVTCTKLTQLHDTLLVTRVSVTKLIGCRAAVPELQLSSVEFVCCERDFS